MYADIDTALGRFRLIPEQPCQHPYVVDYIARQSLRAVEGGWTWKFDPALFDHLEMGADQCDKFVTLKCRSALILGEHSEDSGAQSADYMASITAGVLPIVTIPETFHHMMFDEPLATAMTIKAFAARRGSARTAATKWLQRSHDTADAFARAGPQRMLRKRNRRSESCERPGLSLQIDREPASSPLPHRRVRSRNSKISCIPRRARTNAI